MSEMRLTEFPALSVDPLGFLCPHRRPIFHYFFLPMIFKTFIYHSPFVFIYGILRRITAFYERHSVFFSIAKNRINSYR